MKRLFVMTAGFEKSWEHMGLGDEELRELQNVLLENPDAGDVIPDLAGARKIFLLLAYPKNVQTDMNPAQKKIIRNLIETIKEA